MKAIVSVFAKDAKLDEDLTDCPLPFDALARLLQERGEERGLAVHIQRQDIFDAMHRI